MTSTPRPVPSTARTIRPCGDRAVLIETAGTAEALRLAAALGGFPAPGISEVVPGASTVLVRFDGPPPAPGALDDLLAAADAAAVAAIAPPEVVIAVTYDGEDLAEVARLSRLPVEQVIARHRAADYTVGFVGFAPGFAYLVGGDPALHVPRRAAPRPAVPAGSVALAAEYCGIYPRRSPGGWQLIGRTATPVWDIARRPPALLTPGTRVRFEQC